MGKKHYALIAVLALGLLIAPFMATDSSAAGEVGFEKDAQVNGGFSDMGGGSITVFLYNQTDSVKKVTIVVKEGTGIKATSTVDIPAKAGDKDGKLETDVGLSFGSPGMKTVNIYLYNGEATSGIPLASEEGVSIDVSHSIWKDTTTYLMIIAVIIVIAVALYIKSRGNPLKKSKKEEVSFAELNRARSERRGSTAERKRYDGGKKK